MIQFINEKPKFKWILIRLNRAFEVFEMFKMFKMFTVRCLMFESSLGFMLFIWYQLLSTFSHEKTIELIN